jgi:E3 ubiquitin-protein ligase RNF115/126
MSYFCHTCSSEKNINVRKNNEGSFVCPDCNGDFVEMIDPTDDPRNNLQANEANLPFSFMFSLLPSIFTQTQNNSSVNNRTSTNSSSGTSNNINNPNTYSPNSPQNSSTGQEEAPAEDIPSPQNRANFRFTAAGPGLSFNIISHNLDSADIPPMFQQLASSFMGDGQRFDLSPFLSRVFEMSGNLGDYDLTGQRMDDLITAMMDATSGRSQPPPASEEDIQNLKDKKLATNELGSECAICKEECSHSNVLKTLPCNHYYHKDCILPWLRISGTCPVCRKAPK